MLSMRSNIVNYLPLANFQVNNYLQRCCTQTVSYTHLTLPTNREV